MAREEEARQLGIWRMLGVTALLVGGGAWFDQFWRRKQASVRALLQETFTEDNNSRVEAYIRERARHHKV